MDGVYDSSQMGGLRVKECLFVGDSFSLLDNEFLSLNKITHVVACDGREVRMPRGQRFLDLGWHASNPEKVGEVAIEIVEGLLGEAEKMTGGLLLVSSPLCRAVCIASLLLSRRFHWNFKKSLEFISGRRTNLVASRALLSASRLACQALEGVASGSWDELLSPMPHRTEELLLRNTHLNLGLESPRSSPLAPPRRKRVRWALDMLPSRPKTKILVRETPRPIDPPEPKAKQKLNTFFLRPMVLAPHLEKPKNKHLSLSQEGHLKAKLRSAFQDKMNRVSNNSNLNSNSSSTRKSFMARSQQDIRSSTKEPDDRGKQSFFKEKVFDITIEKKGDRTLNESKNLNSQERGKVIYKNSEREKENFFDQLKYPFGNIKTQRASSAPIKDTEQNKGKDIGSKLLLASFSNGLSVAKRTGVFSGIRTKKS